MRSQNDDLNVERAAWEYDSYKEPKEERGGWAPLVLPIGAERRLTDASSHNDNYDVYRFE